MVGRGSHRAEVNKNFSLIQPTMKEGMIVAQVSYVPKEDVNLNSKLKQSPLTSFASGKLMLENIYHQIGMMFPHSRDQDGMEMLSLTFD